MKTIVYLLAFAVMIASSCSRTANKAPQAPIPQRVLFQQSFVNYAWGYQNRGWFIDNEGMIKAYRVASAEYWVRPDSGYISVDDLLSNYAQADKIIYKIPANELRQKYGLITAAALGEISERTRSAYDAGLVQFSCYWWDQDRGMFKEVLLSLSGDWSQINLSPAAIELDSWLKRLNQIYVDSLAAQNKGGSFFRPDRRRSEFAEGCHKHVLNLRPRLIPTAFYSLDLGRELRETPAGSAFLVWYGVFLSSNSLNQRILSPKFT